MNYEKEFSTGTLSQKIKFYNAMFYIEMDYPNYDETIANMKHHFLNSLAPQDHEKIEWDNGLVYKRKNPLKEY